MDVSDGEDAGNGAVGAMGAVNGVCEDATDVAVAGLGDVVGNEDGEDGGVSSSNEGGVANRVSGSVAGFSTCVATPLVGTRICSPHSS